MCQSNGTKGKTEKRWCNYAITVLVYCHHTEGEEELEDDLDAIFQDSQEVINQDTDSLNSLSQNKQATKEKEKKTRCNKSGQKVQKKI